MLRFLVSAAVSSTVLFPADMLTRILEKPEHPIWAKGTLLSYLQKGSPQVLESTAEFLGLPLARRLCLSLQEIV